MKQRVTGLGNGEGGGPAPGGKLIIYNMGTGGRGERGGQTNRQTETKKERKKYECRVLSSPPRARRTDERTNRQTETKKERKEGRKTDGRT